MNETATIGLFARAIRRITGVWRDMAAGVPDDDDGIAPQMPASLSARGGELPARPRAADDRTRTDASSRPPSPSEGIIVQAPAAS